AVLAQDGRCCLVAPVADTSWPSVVRGGGLVALFVAAAVALGEIAAHRILEGRLTSSVPIDTALALEGHPDDGAIRLTVLQDGQTLASGAILALAPGEREATAAWASADEGWPLPMSELCLACGRLN